MPNFSFYYHKEVNVFFDMVKKDNFCLMKTYKKYKNRINGKNIM